LGRIRVVGKSEPIEVFEAFDAADLGDATFITTYHRALEAFERNDFDRARLLPPSRPPAPRRRRAEP
jgi:adenylate cyclase